MPIGQGQKKKLARARAQVKSAEAARGKNNARLTALQASLRQKRAVGASAAQIATLTRQLTDTRAKGEELRAAFNQSHTVLAQAKADVAGADPADAVANLPADAPIALLPVQLEYRFFTDPVPELKLRIYPRDLHIDDHQLALTSDEVNVGRDYWTAVFAERAADAETGSAWQNLARTLGPGRAAWVAEALRPTNLETSDLTMAPAFPPVEPNDDDPNDASVRALPARWVLLGYRGGQEVVRVWSVPVDEALSLNLIDEADDDDLDVNATPPDDDGQTPQAGGLDWLLDYDTAQAAGMAISVTAQDDADVATGYDEVIVLGVDWTREADEAGQALETLLSNQIYAQGVEIPAIGTATNLNEERTAKEASSFSDRQTIALDPLAAPVTLDPASDGALLNAQLGFGEASPLARAPGAERLFHTAQADMNAALYEGTLGYFADQLLDPMVSDSDGAQLKTHFIDHIRPLGALPLLRIGDEPLGVLPVVASRAYTAAPNAIAGKIQVETTAWRDFWRQAAGNTVPRLGGSADADADLLDVLRMSARATDFRIREVVGPTLVANFANFQAEHAFQEAASDLWQQLGNYTQRPFLADVALSRLHHRVRLAFVERGPGEDPLGNNVLTAVANTLRLPGGFKAMLETRLDDPDSVLEALITYAALLELGKGAAQLTVALDASLLSGGKLMARDREIDAPDGGGTDAPTGLSLVKNALAQQPAVASGRVVVDEVARIMREGTNDPGIERNVLRPSRRFETALRRLSTQSRDALNILLTGTLDSLSHRMDCWMSSLANERLATMRNLKPRGVHLGGFGWLDAVRPGAVDTGSGLTLAPSINQAKAAAVLMAGHAAHVGDDPSILAVDLSSARVRTALKLIEGLRQGQSAGALLGYRLERDLARRRLSLVQFVGPLRRIAPLGQVNQVSPGTPLEAVETREVVDGVQVLELWRDNPSFFTDHPELPQNGRDRSDLDRALAALDDTLDALNDLMLAEGVYQYVNGNTERAAAALDSLERQAQFPEPEIAQTPRSARLYHHRLAVTLEAGGLPPEWGGLPPIENEPRARADPRINRWQAELFGDPAKYRFSGTLFVEVEERIAGVSQITRQQHEIIDVGLLDLRLHPGAIVAAAQTPDATRPSELEARIERALRAKVQAPLPEGTLGTQLEINADPPQSGQIGFAGFTLLIRQMASVMGTADFGDAGTLSSEDSAETGFDTAELETRVTDVRVSFLGAVAALDPDAGSTAIRTALETLSGFGVQNALPVENDAGLRAQARQITTFVEVILARLEAHQTGFARPKGDAEARVRHDIGTLKILFGESFAAVPLIRIDNAQAQVAAVNNAATLVPGGPSDVTDWLRTMAPARPGVARLTRLLDASRAARIDEDGADPAPQVIQLPHDPDARWIGLPLGPDLIRPDANLSIVVHPSGGAVDFARPLGVLAIDAWEDRIPDAHQEAAVTFQYDAPNAQAPQSLLLAVPPRRDQQDWTFDDVLGAVREAKDLSQIRMADLAHLDLLPRLLPALYFPFDLDKESVGLNFGHAIEVGTQMNARNR